MLLLIITSLLTGTVLAGPKEGPPAEGREAEVARELLHQAQQMLDMQYRERPTAGFRYTVGVAAALAGVRDHDAAEALFSHIRLDNRFGDVRLRALAVAYARGGDLARVRQTIGRIQDAEPDYAEQRPLVWGREKGKFLNNRDF